MKQLPGRSILSLLPRLAAPLSALAAAYVALSPVCFKKFYAQRVFKPTGFPDGSWNVAELGGVPRQDVTFSTTDNLRLFGWFFRRLDSDFVFVLNHGNSGNMTTGVRLATAELLLKSGASVFLYDYRGYGRSEGKPSLQGICDDGAAAVDFLIAHEHYRAEQIVLYGESLGCSVASATALARPCAGVVLQSGFTSLPAIGGVHFPFTRIYPKIFFPKPRLDNAELIAKVKRPVLIMHGHKDQVVPFSHAKQIFSRAAEPKMLVELPECAHSDIPLIASDTFVATVKTFLATLREYT